MYGLPRFHCGIGQDHHIVSEHVLEVVQTRFQHGLALGRQTVVVVSVLSMVVVAMAVVVRRVKLRLDLFNLCQQRSTLVRQFRFKRRFGLRFLPRLRHAVRRHNAQGVAGVMRL